MIKHSRSAHVRPPQSGISPAGLLGTRPAPQMKYMRFALFACFGLLVAIFALAWFKDSHWTAEGALVIEVAPEKLVPLTASPKRWLEWNPWSDPTEEGFEATFEGPESGPGAKLRWKSANKHGELVIRSVDGVAGVAYTLSLDDLPGEGELRFEPYGTQTRVRWRYGGDFEGNLFARYFVGLMQSTLVPTLQKGLGRLRELALERANAPTTDPEPR